MNNHKDSTQLQGVLDLLEQKQNNPGDTDIETNFFNKALEYLLTNTVEHWWCTKTTLPIARESLWLFSLPDHDPIIQYKKKLNSQLQSCTYCVQAYQTSKQCVKQRYDVLFPKKTVDGFFSLIDRFDLSRVKTMFKCQETNFKMTDGIMCALLETIYSPHLLKDSKCDELFCKVFSLIQQTGSFPTFESETATFVIRMTLHHNRIVRFWSRKLIERFIADEYRFSEQEFMQTKELILDILKTFTKDSEQEDFGIRINDCPFEITQDLGELWKLFRLIIGVSSSDMLIRCLNETKISMPQIIHLQLSGSAEWLSEILKTMTAMLLKIQSGFWGKISSNSTFYYEIVKQICEHAVFQTAMKIAREGNTGKILQRDGTRYPDDKLMAKIKSMLEWIYPYWSSLQNSTVEKDITQKILDTTFGYFQMETWGVMSRAYCAELGLQIIDQCLADNSLPVENMNEYVTKIVGFAKIDSSKLPVLVQHMPTVARNILSDLVDRYSTSLNKAFNAFYQIFELSEDSEESMTTVDFKTSPYESVWISLKSCFDDNVKEYPWLAKLLFKAYSNIASADISNLLIESKKKKTELTEECKNILIRMADIRTVVGKTLKISLESDWEIRKSIFSDTEMIKPILHLICCSFQEINQDAKKLIQQYPRQLTDQDLFHDFFYLYQPLKVLEAFNSILREFIALNSSATLDMFASVPSITHFLSLQVNLLTNTPSGYLRTLLELGHEKANDEDGIINEFWDVCWRTISIILDKSVKWADQYPSTAVASIIVPVLDTATMMMDSRNLFEKAINVASKSKDAILSYDNINTMTDALSHWIYVTRQDIISRLIPLTIKILDTLKDVQVKISVGSYDRLMTAATGLNSSKLTKDDKEALFIALSAHEPTDFIFLHDDSDDEDVEWQSINSPKNHIEENSTSVNTPPIIKPTSKPRQITLNQSFSNVSISNTPRPVKQELRSSKITNYFPATAAEPHEISDDEIEDEFGGMDYSQVPDEWFEVKTETTTPTLESASKGKEKYSYFGDAEPMDIVEVPSASNRIDLTPTLTEEPVQTTTVKKQAPIVKDRPNMTRVYLPQTKQPTFAVTSKGRKLRPPSMGFSKLKNLREEFRAERRLIATAKSPSAAGADRQKFGIESSGSSSDSSSDEGGDDSGLLGLIYDLDESETSNNKNATIQAESASVKALFETKPKRTIKLLATPISNEYIDRKFKARAREQHRRQKITPNIDRMFKTLFSWDILENRELPPNSNESMLNYVPQNFASFEEYRSIFEPLLMLEAWTQLVRSKEQLSESDVMEGCLVEGRCHTNDFVDITFGVSMSVINNNLSQDDLVCIANHFGPSFFNMPSMGEKSAWKGKSFLGKVMSINQKKNFGEIVVRCFFASDRISILNSISPKTSWHMLRIMSLTTTMREYAALESLEYYDLGKDIIQPHLSVMPKPTPAQIEQYRERYDVNEPQAEAIVCAIQKKKGFSLIQGPPGTGKTKTILSLIVSLLDQRTNTSSDQPYGTGKILVCAPSNAAVDEIAKRLKEGVLTSRGMRQPNIVRIGVADSVNASVKDRILDRLIEEEMDSSEGKNGSPGGKWGAKLDALHQDIRNIQISLDDVDRDIAQSGSDMVQMSILRDKRKALGQKLTRSKILLKDTFQDQKNHGKELEISRVRARQKVFANADVVCATLSGSGHDMLTAMGVSFETVIVDEAAQSIEISSLIPLKFDTQRCVLVGDPNQLPPTVISPLAAKYHYQQSLFMRLEYTMAEEVNLLSIQYRMHPDISRFPSKLFYKSRLLDGPNMEKNSLAIWHELPEFPPYRFFNIVDGQEKVGRGKSIYNVAEADAAVALVDMLCTKLPTVKFASKIGIITPYKQQVSQLKSKFQRRFGNSIIDVIDFNTVDGFQGQEKEIIIFSCVRAGQNRGIGFLSDMRRMNVGLTRAKCSLFVLGNARSLYSSDCWSELVIDAKNRSLITNCEYPYFHHKISELSIPRNIFENSSVVIKKKTMHYKRGAIKIFEPHSNSNSDSEGQVRVGGIKRSNPSPEHLNSRSRKIRDTNSLRDIKMEEPPIIKLDSKEDDSTQFLEKVRRTKETKTQSVQSTPPTPSSTSKLSISAYRASRGLPPLPTEAQPSVPTPHPLTPARVQSSGTSGATSSLFINKKKQPVSRPKPVSIWPEGVTAREAAVMEHSAAKERLKHVRQEERQRDSPTSSSSSTRIRNFDSILDDVQSNNHHRRENNYGERRDDRNQKRYDERRDDRNQNRYDERRDNRYQNRYNERR